MRRCVSVVMVAAWVLVLGSRLLAGEVTNADLMAEIKAMRAAYEGRISSLETKIKDLQTERTDQKRVAEIHKGIDKALGEDEGSKRHHVTRSDTLKGENTVRASSQMTMGGYTEFVYTDREDRDTQFDQLRTVLEFGAQIHERVTAYIELEYEHGGVVNGQKTGTSTDGEVEMEQAWVDLQFHDAINFRAGTILVPVGRYNLYHEAWNNNLIDRPLVSRRITPTTWFEEGMGLHGQAFDTSYLGISYEAYVFNPGRAADISNSGGFRGVRNQNNTPLYDAKKAAAFRVAFEPARSLTRFADLLEIGVSGYVSDFHGRRATATAPKLGGDGTVQIWSLDWTYEKSFKEKGTLGFRGEAAMAHVSPGRTNRARGQQAWGYYAEAYYSFWPDFMTSSSFGRGFKDPRIVFAVRHDWTDLDIDRFDQRDLGRTTVGLSYRPTQRVVYKFDYQMDHSPSHDGPGHPDSGDGANTDAFLFSVAVGF